MIDSLLSNTITPTTTPSTPTNQPTHPLENRVTLWASIIMSLFSAVLGLVSGQFALTVFGLLLAAVNFCYLRSVRRFIPFAAAQL